MGSAPIRPLKIAGAKSGPAVFRSWTSDKVSLFSSRLVERPFIIIVGLLVIFYAVLVLRFR